MSTPASTRAPRPVVITDAHDAASKDISRRQRNYLIAMGFRVVCFIGCVFVDGWLRWAMIAGAVVIPMIAVMLANLAHDRGAGPGASPVTADHTTPALTGGQADSDAADATADPAATSPEVIVPAAHPHDEASDADR